MNPRHLRSPRFLTGRHRRWAFHFFGLATAKVLLLSTRVAGNWTSLRFLIDRLEDLWLRSQDPLSPEVKLSLVEDRNFPTGLSWSPESLVLLFPQPGSVRDAAALRDKNPDLRVTYQLSFEPSAFLRSFWDGQRFHPVKTSDVFVVLCDADQRLIRKVFPEATVRTLTLPGYADRKVFTGPVTSLCYAGRLSPAKNVRLVVLAYALALRLNPDLPALDLVGKWDNGGNQFDELRVDDYEADLRSLVATLGLQNRVNFRGYLEKDDWKNYLAEQHRLYVSASLLLDENHGVAPREFADAGHRVVLPAWGGFRDIKARHVSPVRNGDELWLDPWDLARAIADEAGSQSLTSPGTSSPVNPLDAYVPRESSREDLEASSWALSIHRKLTALEETHLYQTGPYRSQELLPELRTAILDAYAPDAKPPGERPSALLPLPWVTEKASLDFLWERGLAYSAGPPIASSQRGP